jgi:hypothetical protein
MDNDAEAKDPEENSKNTVEIDPQNEEDEAKKEEIDKIEENDE